jgi:membrane dipeptidase
MTPAAIKQLHREATVALSYVNPWIEYAPGGVSARRYFTESAWWMEASIPMMRKGGVDLVVLSHGNPDPTRFPGALAVECMVKCYDVLVSEINRNRDLVLVLNRRDLDRAMREKKMGIILGITAAPFNGDLAVMRALFAMGVRTVHPFANDPTIGGFAGGPKQLGLKPFGRKIIREMERLGMLVDVTHTNDRTFADAIRFAEKPLINSHTNCRAIADYDRCCTDDQLRALAKAGGLIGAHFGFLDMPGVAEGPAHQRMLKAFYKKLGAMQRKYKDPYEFLQHRNDPFEWPAALGGAVDDGTSIYRSKLTQLIAHIRHMVDVAGIDHVCIGSDYSSGNMPVGVETAETLCNLTGAMVRDGFSAGAVKKIWGANFLRILGQTLPA